jgi:hypothetical protein
MAGMYRAFGYLINGLYFVAAGALAGVVGTVASAILLSSMFLPVDWSILPRGCLDMARSGAVLGAGIYVWLVWCITRSERQP